MKRKPNEPIHTIEYNNNYISNGLTKREYFAVMALQGLLANSNIQLDGASANTAILFADALIEELSKTKTNEKK
jgi:hypothetical protein